MSLADLMTSGATAAALYGLPSARLADAHLKILHLTLNLQHLLGLQCTSLDSQADLLLRRSGT